MFYDKAYSRIVRYGHANVYGSAKIHHWRGDLPWRKWVVLRKGTILSHYIFASPSWDLLTEFEKFYASWLIANYYGLQWKNGMVPYSMTKRLITIAVTGTEEDDDDDNEILVYVKEFKKMWMTDGYARKRNKGRHDHRNIGYRLRKCGIFKKVYCRLY